MDASEQVISFEDHRSVVMALCDALKASRDVILNARKKNKLLSQRVDRWIQRCSAISRENERLRSKKESDGSAQKRIDELLQKIEDQENCHAKEIAKYQDTVLGLRQHAEATRADVSTTKLIYERAKREAEEARKELKSLKDQYKSVCDELVAIKQNSILQRSVRQTETA